MIRRIYLTFDRYLSAGGGQVIYRQLLERKNQTLHTNDIIICPEGDLAEACRNIVTVLPLQSSGNENFNQVRHTLQSVDFSNTELHIHGISVLPLAIATSFNIPIKKIYTEHLMTKDYRLPNALKDILQKFGLFVLLRSVDEVRCVSHAVAWFIEKRMLINKRKIRVVYNPMPEISSTPVHHKERTQYTIVSTGALIWIKNYFSLLRIAQKVLVSFPHVTFHIFGNGNEKEQLLEFIKQESLGNNVFLHGTVPHEELLDFIKATPVDLYMQTSRSESFGYGIAEAMAFGIPAVAYNVGGIPEVIDSYTNGALIPFGDETLFAQAIIALLQDTDKRALYGKEARKKIAAGFVHPTNK